MIFVFGDSSDGICHQCICLWCLMAAESFFNAWSLNYLNNGELFPLNTFDIKHGFTEPMRIYI